MAKEIFKINDLDFSSRPTFALNLLISYLLEPQDLSLYVLYGDYWKFTKKLFVTELLGPWQLERSCGDRREEFTRFMHKLLKKASKNNEAAVDLGAE
ncbi:hypothetical protein NC652_002833 [Populus alba x Populus x berolinensis]|nr:hypothetical protein NC652_002833 [Populus alba x Populus x berolinensis]